jgi:hypothetical protein
VEEPGKCLVSDCKVTRVGCGIISVGSRLLQAVGEGSISLSEFRTV